MMLVIHTKAIRPKAIRAEGACEALYHLLDVIPTIKMKPYSNSGDFSLPIND